MNSCQSRAPGVAGAGPSPRGASRGIGLPVELRLRGDSRSWKRKGTSHWPLSTERTTLCWPAMKLEADCTERNGNRSQDTENSFLRDLLAL